MIWELQKDGKQFRIVDAMGEVVAFVYGDEETANLIVNAPKRIIMLANAGKENAELVNKGNFWKQECEGLEKIAAQRLKQWSEMCKSRNGYVVQNEKLRASLRNIAEQRLSTELEEDQDGDFVAGYDAIVIRARMALS